MFFRADSVTLNTPHTTKKSEKLIFRTTKIIGTLPRIVGRGEIGPKSAQLSCGVYQALFLKKISVNLAPGSYISSLSSLLLFFYFTPSSIVILEFGSVPDFLYWCLPPPSVPPSLRLCEVHTLLSFEVKEAACPWNSSNAFHWIPLLCLARPLKPSCCHPVLCQLCVCHCVWHMALDVGVLPPLTPCLIPLGLGRYLLLTQEPCLYKLHCWIDCFHSSLSPWTGR